MAPSGVVGRSSRQDWPNAVSRTATDHDLLLVIDDWVRLLEAEDYQAAFDFADPDPGQRWTADLVRLVIKSYGEADELQRATVEGVPTDVAQRKEVDRWPANARGTVGEVWYDLNIDGLASDLTATFDILELPEGLGLRLRDVHVM